MTEIVANQDTSLRWERRWALPFGGLVLALFLALTLTQFLLAHPRETDSLKPLPALGAVPDARLTDAHGNPFSPGDLKGRVWVATLFFTHCDGTCPMMASQMARLQKTIEGTEAALVSISVDPARDTVERLKWYSDMVGAKPGVWHFVTGATKTVIDLAENHFKLGTGLRKEAPKAADEAPAAQAPSGEIWEFEDEQPAPASRQDEIPHSTRFALVDGQGTIRGYYDGLEESGVAHLREDIAKLLKEQKP